MDTLTKTYSNGETRTLTVTSACYCNPSCNAAIVMTQESGAVLVSHDSNLDLWNQLLASNIVISAYVDPEQTPERLNEKAKETLRNAIEAKTKQASKLMLKKTNGGNGSTNQQLRTLEDEIDDLQTQIEALG